jgi:phosphohistidine phosphatase
VNLFLVRHAAAVPRGRLRHDAARPLTDEGRQRFTRVVAGLERLGVRFAAVRHSPWTRARETAELLAPICDGELREDALLAGAPSEELLRSLRSDRLALVGHAPWLPELLAWLVAGATDLGDRFAMKKGAVAWLEGRPRPGQMTLTALLPPRVSRRAR